MQHTTPLFDEGWNGLKYTRYKPLKLYVGSAEQMQEVATSDSITQYQISMQTEEGGAHTLTLIREGLTHYSTLSRIHREERRIIPLTADTTRYVLMLPLIWYMILVLL